MSGFSVVRHGCRGTPTEPFQDTEIAVFDTNVPVLFHVIESVRTVGVPRLETMSSETAPGYMTGDPVLLPDNLRGEPLADLVARAYGDQAPPIHDLEREDAGAISVAKARRLFGWEPRVGLAGR